MLVSMHPSDVLCTLSCACHRCHLSWSNSLRGRLLPSFSLWVQQGQILLQCFFNKKVSLHLHSYFIFTSCIRTKQFHHTLINSLILQVVCVTNNLVSNSKITLNSIQSYCLKRNQKELHLVLFCQSLCWNQSI